MSEPNSAQLGTCNYWRCEHVEGSHDMCLGWVNSTSEKKLGDGEPSSAPDKFKTAWAEYSKGGHGALGWEKIAFTHGFGEGFNAGRESGAAQEVSPVGSVQKITGPERPRCPVCGAETTCLSCGTKNGGDMRELKAALSLDELMAEFCKTRAISRTGKVEAMSFAQFVRQRLLGEPTKE